MHRYVQTVPPPADPYAGDPLLRSWLERHLGADGHAAAKDRLAGLADEVVGPLRIAQTQAEAHPPVLHRYDAWGARVDRVETPAGWETHRRAAARHGLVALPYLASSRRDWGTGARVLQHALLHLYGPESATFSCPVAMSDAAAALLARLDAAAERDGTGLLAAEAGALRDVVATVTADRSAAGVIAGARTLALRLASALAAALLVEWGDEATGGVAPLWIRRRLGRIDVSAELHAAFDALCPA